MRVLPVVFCMDDRLLMPAGICLTSLLEHSNQDTFYDIFFLHDDQSEFPNSGYLERLKERYQNFSITYRNVGNAFQGAYEIRGITIPAYYRLLIPLLIPEYDKIMYHDVDVIFRDDLSDIFLSTEMDGAYVAGVALPYYDKYMEKYIKQVIGLKPDKYICSGNIILNSKKIIADGLVCEFIEVAKQNWKFQDMDVINLVCKDKIKYLPPSFCMISRVTSEILKDPDQQYYSKADADYAIRCGIVHYNGAKPWQGWCLNFDIWWEYYRKSVFYDLEVYFTFYCNKLDEHDNYTLWKRVKILFRHFKLKNLLRASC